MALNTMLSVKEFSVDNYQQLIHDLNSIKYKIGIITVELTPDDLSEKTELYSELMETLKKAKEILKSLE